MGKDILEVLNLQSLPNGLQTDNSHKNRQIGLIIAIIGMALIIISQTQKFIKTRTFNAGLGITDTDVYEDKTTKNLILYSGITALIIGGIVFASGFNPPTTNLQASHNSLTSSKNQDDTILQLEKLDALRKKGIITDEEFSRKKTELLSKL